MIKINELFDLKCYLQLAGIQCISMHHRDLPWRSSNWRLHLPTAHFMHFKPVFHSTVFHSDYAFRIYKIRLFEGLTLFAQTSADGDLLCFDDQSGWDRLTGVSKHRQYIIETVLPVRGQTCSNFVEDVNFFTALEGRHLLRTFLRKIGAAFN